MSFQADSIDDGGGASDSPSIPEAPEHPEPHVSDHDGRKDFPDVHLLDINLVDLYSFDDVDNNVGLPQPHAQDSSRSKEQDLLLAVGLGVNLSLGRFTTGASLGLYISVDLNSKAGRMGTYISVGMPGGANVQTSGGLGFNASISPSLTAGFGNANNGFFGPATVLNLNAPALNVGVVSTPDYKSMTFSEGAGAGFNFERTTTESMSELNSFDLQRCVYELNQFIIRGTGY